MRGILFKPWKHKAIRENPDREWQTRRLMSQFTLPPEAGKPYLSDGYLSVIPDAQNFKGWAWITDDKGRKIKPRYQVGEVVYIKEAWMIDKLFDKLKPSDIRGDLPPIWYWNDGNHYADKVEEGAGRVRSPLFMPAWAARDFIQIINVRPERLQEITEEDALAEGIKILSGTWQSVEEDSETGKLKLVGEPQPYTARYHYEALWDSINPKYPWASNPWCWVYTFKLIQKEQRNGN